MPDIHSTLFSFVGKSVGLQGGHFNQVGQESKALPMRLSVQDKQGFGDVFQSLTGHGLTPTK